MKVQKKDLAKSQLELLVELTVDELKPYIKQGVEKISAEIKVEGFRPGKATYEVLKQKIGEMTILEESARIAIDKTLEKVIKDNVARQPVGQPQVNITKLAPNNPMEYKVILALLPDIELGDYKNVKVKLVKEEVKEDEVDKMIERLQEMRVKEVAVDREIKNNDKALVDIKMFLDKVPVEGGQSQATGVIIGKGYIVPGFGKKLIGAKKGDVREFSLPYPKDHHQKNLAGKLVEFKVSIKDVFDRELPKIDNDFVKNFGLKNVEQLKDNIKKSILNEKQGNANQKAEVEMLDKIIEKTKFSDIPEILINNESKTMMSELEANVARQGGQVDDYLSHLKKTREQLILDMLPDALKRVKTSLLIREIANVEKIKVDDKEMEKELQATLEQYKKEKSINPQQTESEEKVKEHIYSPAYKEYLRNLISGRKVINKLKEWNVAS